MRLQRPSHPMRFILAFVAITLATAVAARAAASETVLHNFSGAGTWHPSTLARDAAGNLYGIDGQSVFQLKISPGGAVKETVLYTFPPYLESFPANPVGPLTVDAAGNLYGVTRQSGTYPTCAGLGGCGTVFELSPGRHGWLLTTLYNFGGFTVGDGVLPSGGLIFDAAGNLYGTTLQGGANTCAQPSNGCGTVFELSPGPGGWTESILHSFSVKGTEGWFPFGPLTLDSSGNLYGTTQRGTVFELSPTPGGFAETTLRNVGNDSKSTLNAGLLLDSAGHIYGSTSTNVFTLSPNPGGTFWKYKVVQDFPGVNPGDLVFDENGNIFGDTRGNAINDNGTLFVLTPGDGGTWVLGTFYTFTGAADGAGPASMVRDPSGNLYVITHRPIGVLNDGLEEIVRVSPAGIYSAWIATVLLSGNNADGFYPTAGVVLDAAGNLYGTTAVGGKYGFGTVYRASSTPSGWKTSVLYSFRGGADGGIPRAGLRFDSAGNLFGTTSMGGDITLCSQGCGTVFALSPVKKTWKQRTLYSFTGGSDGAVPLAGLTFDAAGNLYGTTSAGGHADCVTPFLPLGCGTVFELSPVKTKWKERTLYAFAGTDGSVPVANLVFDAAGNLYGTTELGGILNAFNCGTYGCGSVFKLSPGGGSWTLTTLYAFTGQIDGGNPLAGLTFDSAGNLYGTTQFGGTFSTGVAFQLTPSPSGWSETVLHSFGSSQADGTYPTAGLLLDAAGNLFGTTARGGVAEGVGYSGAVFELSPIPGGWTESILAYQGAGFNGGFPRSGLTADPAGNLYGTTFGQEYLFSTPGLNCSSSCGTVYQISGR